jgi:hypothetical protein
MGEAPDADAGSGDADAAESANVSGLHPLTTYHFRVVATNAAGTSIGADQEFTTNPLAPAAETLPASDLAQSSATLNGSVNPKGVATSYHFEFGPSAAYGSVTPDQSAAPSGSTLAVSAALSALGAGGTYHFRLVAKSAGGTTSGGDQTFTTARPSAPVVSALSARARCVRGAQLTTPTDSAAGLAFSFKLSAKATVKYVITRRTGSPGKSTCPVTAGKVPGRATQVTSREREGDAGDHTTSLASAAARVTPKLLRKLKAGRARVTLAQIVQTTKLKPGTYVLYVSATDSAGQRSNVARVKFWVLSD